MEINSDSRDLLRSFNEAGVRYLVVGGYAWMAHTEPRYTKDLDVWIEPVEANARLVVEALACFGTPTSGVTPADFTEPDTCYQIGVAPARIDIMSSVRGLEFGAAWQNRVTVDFEGVAAPILSWEDVQAEKAASGSKWDRAVLLEARRSKRG